jgi:hypothetical protein
MKMAWGANQKLAACTTLCPTLWYICVKITLQDLVSMSPYTYDYPRPSLTVDVVTFTLRENRLQVLLIQRGEAPYAGMWALPGGFVHLDESL